MVTAVTMTHAEEAIGIARAAQDHGLPAVISFTVETDGRLPDGQPLSAAIEQVDAETGGSVAYFMINCAHPTHFADVLEQDGAWRERIGGLRANASAKSHAELDEAEELDEGDPLALGAEHGALRPRLGAVAVLGGCCGTDSPPRGGDRARLDGLRQRPRPRGSFAPCGAQSWPSLAGVALAAGGFALGRVSADTDAGHDAGVREGHAAGLEEGRALQATGSPASGTRAAFGAGYAAGANDVFAGLRWRVVAVGALRHHPRPRERRGRPIASIRAVSRGSAGAQATAAARTATAARKSSRRSATLGVAGDLELGARGVQAEGLDPCALGSFDPGVRLGGGALLVGDVGVLDVQDVHARARAVGDPQLDRAPQPERRGEARGAAQDGADIDRLARARRAPGPAVAPAGQRADHGQQVAGALGQLVVHARRAPRDSAGA